MDYKDLAIKWFNKANNDLIAGNYILTMPDPPADTICFHSQQSVEKYPSELSSYAVDVRYPMEGNYDVTIEEAKRAIDIAGKIKIFVLNKLELS
ncbi:MAG TPA: hypothetical protein VKL21_09040 [Candidatus Methanoperedens sp.]|nr:hypothetical protein [Candidatus Methanoperedens sp.]